MDSATLDDVTDVSIEIDAQLRDAVPPPRCEWGVHSHDECPELATWFGRGSCGHSFYFCTEHQETGEIVRLLLLSKGATPTCGAHRPPVSVEIEWVRL